MTDSEWELMVRYLNGEATQNEEEQIKEWLNEQANRIRFEQFKEIWIASGEVYRTYTPDLVQARKRIQTEIDSTVKLNTWRWVGKAAAILISIIGLGWTITKYKQIGENHQVSMHEITTGSVIDTFVLSDGSTVWLNKGTRLKFPGAFTGSERRVFLSGEAFFSIAHNADKPFIVEAGRTLTKVLGTSFNLKVSEDSVSVAVRTGKVLFSEHSNAKNFEFLAQDEMAAFTYAGHSIRKSSIDGSHLPSWIRDIIFFKNTPLSEVVAKLSNHYEVSIYLDPTIPGSLSLTSTFEDQGVEEVLQVVCATLDLRMESTTEGYRLYGRANDKIN